MKRLLILATALCGWACSGVEGTQSVGRVQLQQLVRSRGIEPVELVIPYRLTGEMRQWLRTNVPNHTVEPEERLSYLTEALFDPDSFGLEYDKRHTGTAEQVFIERRANCLAFTFLFVGLARELGVPVFFVEVRDVESYEKEGDLVVVSDHVAVGFGPKHRVRVIDFATDPGARDYRRIGRITDERAIAMFYSNRGAEHLRDGNYETALDWLRTSVAIDPGYAASWVNVGVSLRRSGDLEGAEAAYRQALQVDLTSGSAMQNLAAILNSKGQVGEALELLALTDRIGNRNPYTYVTLGDLSMRHGHMEEAGRFYRKAMRRREDQAEPLAALGLWELHQGERRKARKLLKRAEEINPGSDRVALLKVRLGTADTG